MGTEIVKRGESVPERIEHGVSTADAMGAEVARAAEMGTAQLEAQARALVQARFFIAKQPQMQRVWDQVEQKLRAECIRPRFAHSAWWILPLGGDPNKYPKGLSIRFAEAALRMAGNIDVQQQTVFDDAWKRIVRVTVMDLETNFAYTSEVTVEKTVERAKAGDREVLSVRQNSSGKMTYLVSATEQELALKQGSAVSKAIRTQGLRLIPGDILDECKSLIEATRAKGANAEDPEAARKVILDNFAEIGVMPVDLAKYLEHDTNIFQPAERDLLRGLYSAIKSGMGTWKDVMEAKFGVEGEESAGAKKIKDALARRKPAAAPAAAAAQQTADTKTEAKAEPKQETAAQPEQDPADPNFPPTNLQNLADWPDSPEADWYKIAGKVYRYSEQSGNYQEWVDPRGQAQQEQPKQQAQQDAPKSGFNFRNRGGR